MIYCNLISALFTWFPEKLFKGLILVSVISSANFLSNYFWYDTLCKKCRYLELFWSTFFPHFPAFGLNTARNSVSLRVQSECGKMQEKCGPEYLRMRTLYTQYYSYQIRFHESKSLCYLVKCKSVTNTAQKMNFSIKDFFSKREQICNSTFFLYKQSKI